MGKKLFGGGSGSAEDVESLLTLHGVLCAFLVSLSIGFEANLAATSTERMNFFGALAKEPSFREWIVYVVDNKYNQSHETGALSMPFAWNLTVAPGIWVDLKQEMLHGFLARQRDNNLECVNDGCKLPDIVGLKDPWLSMATSVLFPEMDMQFMETWFLHNPKACLIANVLLYISWVLSPSQKEDHGNPENDESKAIADAAGALSKWKLVGMPLLFLNYIMLLAAIVLMFFANAYSMWFADPYPLKAADIYGVAGFYTIVLIVTFVLFIVGGIAAFCLSAKGDRALSKTGPEQGPSMASK